MLDPKNRYPFRTGIQTAWSTAKDYRSAIDEIKASIDINLVGHLIIFAARRHDSEALIESFSKSFPDVGITGCTTAGEITPVGFLERSISVLALPKKGFNIKSAVIKDVAKCSFETGGKILAPLFNELEDDTANYDSKNVFALCFIDGMSFCEESVVSSLNSVLEGVPLIGGSAGDNLHFESTAVYKDGKRYPNSAVIHLIHSDYPFHIFKNDHFEPTMERMVVTASDTEHRIVKELNAEPAADEYARIIGLDDQELTPMIFASHPVVVKVGGEYFCRSIQKVNPDGSLSFFCAIDDGIVLTASRPTNMADSLERQLNEVSQHIGGIDFVMGFECILRRLDAQNRGEIEEIEQIYKDYNVLGFHTYGEQYNFMHINQTFSGIAFGRGEK